MVDILDNVPNHLIQDPAFFPIGWPVLFTSNKSLFPRGRCQMSSNLLGPCFLHTLSALTVGAPSVSNTPPTSCIKLQWYQDNELLTKSSIYSNGSLTASKFLAESFQLSLNVIKLAIRFPIISAWQNLWISFKNVHIWRYK